MRTHQAGAGVGVWGSPVGPLPESPHNRSPIARSCYRGILETALAHALATLRQPAATRRRWLTDR